MSCDWFIKPPPPCECCGRGFEPFKIGVSAIGWAFSFDPPGSEREWRNELADKVIIDEYDREYTPAEFWAFVDGKAKLKWRALP